jgi:hypothetical protein
MGKELCGKVLENSLGSRQKTKGKGEREKEKEKEEEMSAMFDFPSFLTVILLFICTAAFTRSMYPTLFDSQPIQDQNGNVLAGKHHGLRGSAWKASRVGEHLNPYIAGCCVIMAFHILFIKPWK